MKTTFKLILILAVIAINPAALGADESGCLACHSKNEFDKLSAGEIGAAVKDAGIPPHKKYADISDEELQLIVKAFAGN